MSEVNFIYFVPAVEANAKCEQLWMSNTGDVMGILISGGTIEVVEEVCVWFG